MSTKTLRKRIALVAVSALGFGLISAAPSSAANEIAISSVVASNGAPAAGSSITLTVTGAAGAVGIGVRLTSPTGVKFYGGSDTNPGTGFNTGVSVAAPSSNVSVVTISTDILIEPGVWTVGAGAIDATGLAANQLDTATEIDTAIGATGGNANAAQLLVSNPATSTAMGISMNAGSYAVDALPVVRAWRPTNGVAGTIKFRLDRSADLLETDGTTAVVLGAVKAATVGGTGSFATYTLDSGNDDTAGTYTNSAWVDTNANGLIDGSEPSASVTFTVSGAADAVTASLNRTTLTENDAYDDFTFTATVTDSLGRAVLGQTVKVSECSSAGADVSTSLTDISDNATMTNVAGTNSYYISGTIDTAPTSADTATVYLCAFIGAAVADGVEAELVSIKSLTVVTIGDLITTVTGDSMAMSTGAGIGSYDASTGLQQTLT
jgi:hypothetical protein